jgi:hypothetical protein
VIISTALTMLAYKLWERDVRARKAGAQATAAGRGTGGDA